MRSGSRPDSAQSSAQALIAGRYELLRPLAKGGMGEVFLARDLATGDSVALKRVRDGQLKRPKVLAHFRAEYHALLAWAKFASAPDKNAMAAQTRIALTKAADASEKTVTARFYLGRVERMLGREKEALAHFQWVVMLKPNHAEAQSELRVLEARLKGKR